MAKMKSKTFIAKAKDIAKNYNTLYVKGCFGAPLTGSNVERYCTNNSYNKAETRTAMIKAAADKNPPYYGFDCVCLIKGILWGWEGDASATYGGAKYASNSVPDIDESAMIAKCDDVTTSDWADMVPGEVVWMSGHIGIYIGDGLAVECTPKWENNVQITAVGNIGSKSGYNKRTWTKHGKLPYVDYSDQDTADSVTAAADSNSSNSDLAAGTKVTLKSVKLYASASTKTASGTKTGTFYIWSAAITNGRIRITTSASYVGKSGKVTGWINASDISGTAAAKAYAVGDKVVINGKIYANGNGGAAITLTNATRYIVNLVSSSTYKYYIGVAKTKGGTRQGWTNPDTLS